MNLSFRLMHRCLRALPLLTVAAACALPLHAATLPNRLQANAQMGGNVPMAQKVSARVQRAALLNHLDGNTPLQTMTLVLSRTAAQDADLDALIAAQQNPSSPQYHRWLTPEQFGERFGISDADRTVVKNWLLAKGFQVLEDAPSKNLIRFSGTASAAEDAFNTTLNRYQLDGQQYFENSTVPQIPAALTSVVSGVRGLSSYRLLAAGVKPRFAPDANTVLLHPDQTSTNGTSTAHFLVPWDVRQIYNANTLAGAGNTGTGVTIGVLGQSAVDTSQIGFFQTLTGQTVKAPTLVLVPSTGTSVTSAGDEGESEADLEYASGVASGAAVSFVYTGSSQNVGVLDSLTYAITNKTGLFGTAPNILTLSYGSCEPMNAPEITTLEPTLRQATAQGQTIVVASGDTGAAGCDDSGSAQLGLQVSYPASSPNVTAVGGTEFLDTTNASTYWSSTNNNQQGSALGYIPEMVWNDTLNSANKSKDPTAGGGGMSRLFSKPNWQTGTGVPADGARDVPDISFSASNYEDPYILCTSDSGYTATSNGTTLTGKCTASTFGAFAVGGTSLSTPSFAGLLSMVIQANGGKALGNINPVLYTLASGASGGTVFHDVTVGGNQIPCVSGFQDCTGGVTSLGYAAAAGYDLASGLGSLNIGAFSTALPSAIAATTQATTVNISQLSASNTAVVLRINVSAANSGTAPTGTVNVTIDGGASAAYTLGSGTGAPTPGQVALSVGSPLTTAGTHTIVANYAGDGTFAAATGTLKLTTLAANAGFTLATSAASMTATATTPGTLKLTTSSTNGFFGLVNYSFAPTSGSATPPGCFTVDGFQISSNLVNTIGLAANAAATNNLQYTEAACTSASLVKSGGPVLAKQQPIQHPRNGLPLTAMAAALAGGLFCLSGIGGKRGRSAWTGRLAALMLMAAMLGAAGCGGSVTNTGGTGTTTGRTYNIVVTATAANNTSITQTTTFSIVAQ